ncbi:MAG: hypothetical protein N2C14_01510, partial [Planctomycetales bacterium]
IWFVLFWAILGTGRTFLRATFAFLFAFSVYLMLSPSPRPGVTDPEAQAFLAIIFGVVPLVSLLLVRSAGFRLVRIVPEDERPEGEEIKEASEEEESTSLDAGENPYRSPKTPQKVGGKSGVRHAVALLILLALLVAALLMWLWFGEQEKPLAMLHHSFEMQWTSGESFQLRS